MFLADKGKANKDQQDVTVHVPSKSTKKKKKKKLK